MLNQKWAENTNEHWEGMKQCKAQHQSQYSSLIIHFGNASVTCMSFRSGGIELCILCSCLLFDATLEKLFA